MGATLSVRVLTDDLSSPNSRHSGSLNLSGVIAVVFIVVAIGLMLHRRRSMLPTVLTVLWLGIWTAIAVGTNGASTETLREGVREVSVVALAVIVYNAPKAVTVTSATRLVQLIGVLPGLRALYQLATDTGLDVAHNIRANGTFAHPNTGAMFFAIAVTASLWCYLDNGRRRSDALLVVLFAAALIATFSIDGLITLAAMLVAFGALHPGPIRIKLSPASSRELSFSRSLRRRSAQRGSRVSRQPASLSQNVGKRPVLSIPAFTGGRRSCRSGNARRSSAEASARRRPPKAQPPIRGTFSCRTTNIFGTSSRPV